MAPAASAAAGHVDLLVSSSCCAMMASTTEGSINVDVSPRSPSCERVNPSAWSQQAAAVDACRGRQSRAPVVNAG